MVKRVFVEKRSLAPTDELKKELNLQLNESVASLRTFLRYDAEGISDADFPTVVQTVFSEPPADNVYYKELPNLDGYDVFAAEYMPGQYDVRSDSAAQCAQLITMGARPEIRCAQVYAVSGAKNIAKIKSYLMNPVDSRLAASEKPLSLKQKTSPPEPVKEILGFRALDKEGMAAFHKETGLAMSLNDILFVQEYFIAEGREPTETEIKVLDTYWSDHCRHTTFWTELKSIKLKTNIPEIKESYKEYKKLFRRHYKNRPEKYPCLMDIATMGMRELKSRKKLPALDESDEVNACAINAKVETTEGVKDYIVYFKNETHNHPTEIEPFGGASTCLGGGIRDPLSGRAFVYHSMRITGAGDVTAPIDKTLTGKLPQRIITREAARGFSSYSNQVGLAAGAAAEIYHPGYVAKRMEAGFLVAAAPKENIVRAKPVPGDIVLLIGAETGRDGCGGATGSSREQKADAMEVCGAEVQKGDSITGRKIQRLFRNPEASRKIKRCNDFGAGGVCVAIGELADGLDINLDVIPVKYGGLSGTELTISESQERMAAVIAAGDLAAMRELCAAENIDVTAVATVTDTNRMVIKFEGRVIVDLKRGLLSSNGTRQEADALIKDKAPKYLDKPSKEAAAKLKTGDYAAALRVELKRLNIASTKGLGQTFDSTAGAGTVFMPLGGEKQLTPALAIAAKIPVYPSDTNTATVASWGYDPYLMSESPFVGAQYAVLLSVAKVCAAGAPYDGMYMTFQEFFLRLKSDPARWGQPTAALLGALTAQLRLGIASVGGKDSMSGTFENIDVPPTLLSFAINTAKMSKLITNVLYDGAKVYRIQLPRSASGCPDFKFFTALMKKLSQEIKSGKIKFCTVVEGGGAATAIAKSCFGSGLGFKFAAKSEDLFYPRLGDILMAGDLAGFSEFTSEYIGEAEGSNFVFGENVTSVAQAEKEHLKTLSGVFPISGAKAEKIIQADFNKITYKPYKGVKIASPRVLIPVLPGGNGEYDLAKKFIQAGADVETFVIRNRSAEDVKASLKELARAVSASQILAFSDSFPGGDGTDNNGRFITAAFRSPDVADAVMELLEVRDGLILGICNGFQALVRLGLLPYGKIAPETNTVYFNNSARHISALAPVRVASVDSPWLAKVKVGDVFMTAVTHGDGRLIASESVMADLRKKGRICTQFADAAVSASDGSAYAVEGLISPCGRILGKMAHTERGAEGLFKNIPGEKVMDIFGAGVEYFK